ncbi:hypothetical protein V490_00494 [Pseudogymnoascus sp. VKM F-3557]|nr:hypothetical protein V490_00494 [Pseudogymnoascus sp. VKM F-3557]
MLTKAKPREEFDYNIERQGQAHYELLQEIHSVEAQPGQSSTPLWTTTATDVKTDDLAQPKTIEGLQRDNANQAISCSAIAPELKEAQKRIAEQQEEKLTIEGVRSDNAVQVTSYSAMASKFEGAQKKIAEQQEEISTIEGLRRDTANQTISHAAIVSELKEAQRRLVEQQDENLTNLTKLSESHKISARQAEEIREFQTKIGELKSFNRAQTREQSQERPSNCMRGRWRETQ